MSIKAALFDLDGTIIDSMLLWEDVANVFLDEYNLRTDETIVDSLKYLTLATSAKFFKQTFDLSITEQEIFNKLLNIVINKYSNEILPKPGAVEIVKFLKQKGIKLYIATANDRIPTEGALKHLQIFDLFDDIFICDEVGYNKKDPRYFEKVLKNIDCIANEVVLFEDALHSIETAVNLGIKVIAIEESTFVDEKEKIMNISDIYCKSFIEIIDDRRIFE